jgi:hypothetical protein
VLSSNKETSLVLALWPNAAKLPSTVWNKKSLAKSAKNAKVRIESSGIDSYALFPTLARFALSARKSGSDSLLPLV